MQKEEQERKAKEEQERRTKEEKERKAKEEQERKAKEERDAAARAAAEAKAKEEAERRRLERQAQQQKQEEEERRRREDEEKATQRKLQEEEEKRRRDAAEQEERERQRQLALLQDKEARIREEKAKADEDRARRLKALDENEQKMKQWQQEQLEAQALEEKRVAQQLRANLTSPSTQPRTPPPTSGKEESVFENVYLTPTRPVRTSDVPSPEEPTSALTTLSPAQERLYLKERWKHDPAWQGPPQLLWIAGSGRQASLSRVHMQIKSLLVNDVFILDTEHELIQWNGPSSSGIKRVRGAQLVMAIKQARYGRSKSRVLENQPDGVFWGTLRGDSADGRAEQIQRESMLPEQIQVTSELDAPKFKEAVVYVNGPFLKPALK
eukprot:g54208.t1